MPNLEKEKLLLQMRLPHRVMDFINMRTKQLGYSRRRYYLLDLLEQDGMIFSMKDWKKDE